MVESVHYLLNPMRERWRKFKVFVSGDANIEKLPVFRWKREADLSSEKAYCSSSEWFACRYSSYLLVKQTIILEEGQVVLSVHLLWCLIEDSPYRALLNPIPVTVGVYEAIALYQGRRIIASKRQGDSNFTVSGQTFIPHLSRAVSLRRGI